MQIYTDKRHTVAIIVTYNRKKMLLECIHSLLDQSVSCDILIVDNASTDGTKEYLRGKNIFQNDYVHYLRLNENKGGTGGFHAGIKYCLSYDWKWFWLMDDDAVAELDALENLLANVNLKKNVYGPAAVGFDKGKKKLCFPAKPVSRRGNRYVEYYEELKGIEEVAWIPFLGFFIHTEMVRLIGLPDQDLFILDDDVEYCERAKKHGAKIFIVKNSVIYHPYQKTIPLNVLGRKVYYRSMPPWKVYFDVRNKIIIAKKYNPTLLYLQTIPGILLRALYSVVHENERLKFFAAYVNGIISGVLNITNKRYLPPVNP